MKWELFKLRDGKFLKLSFPEIQLLTPQEVIGGDYLIRTMSDPMKYYLNSPKILELIKNRQNKFKLTKFFDNWRRKLGHGRDFWSSSFELLWKLDMALQVFPGSAIKTVKVEQDTLLN